LSNGITQCYLLPDRGGRPAFTPTGQGLGLEIRSVDRTYFLLWDTVNVGHSRLRTYRVLALEVVMAIPLSESASKLLADSESGISEHCKTRDTG